ncbi:ribosome biogenesis GTPase [Mariprofundus ferrinatatus]|uniref:Small ribosomal subunit biogenesis GTPase RsgA n=1 Tax=Mariprofundus ferrinatatus TaxID=1921087 RepID=A0A2K8L9Q8_9PROT|nr:ribosome small subunit-dependent GTPase A [Mariprofundus ferrinatatus]ATX82989.1 ribosome biogenesis GTPase [Mariprofundus ferrinatatus]
MGLSELGLDCWFEEHAQKLCGSGQSIARVVAIDRGRIVVHDGARELSAELLGKFFYAAESAARFPCVGDWVCLDHHGSESDDPASQFLSIHSILPRRTLLKRKTVGYDEEFQILASNIDVAFIVMACNYDFHVAKLERFLVMIHEAHIRPVLLFTKTDLIAADALQQLIDNIRAAGIGIEILCISNSTGEGLDRVRRFIEAEKTYCLLGSSGVGKSTLMNRLIGEETFATQEVSESGQGRHTTVRRHLILLRQGGLVVDMPGMRELAISEVKEGIEESFADIIELTQSCRFSNCTHHSEPGCAILAALKSGELRSDHYKNYLKIQSEARHHKKQTGYVEKRRKGKNASRIAPSKTRQRKLRQIDPEQEEDAD